MMEILGVAFLPDARPEWSAILVLPGRWQEWRINVPLRLWPSKAKHLWVAGTNGDPYYTRQDIVSRLGQDSPDVVVAEKALHTRDQMDWCVGLLGDFPDVNHVIISTAAYHLPRCFMTFLQAMKGLKRHIVLTPYPSISPSGYSCSIEELQSEVEKIQRYQASGDVASIANLERYLAHRLGA